MDANISGAPAKKKRRIWTWIVGVPLLLLIAAVATLPYWIVRIPIPELEIDLGGMLPEEFVDTLSNRTLKMNFVLKRHDRWDFALEGRGALLDWPLVLDAKISYAIADLSATSVAAFSLKGDDIRAGLRFEGSAFDGWSARLEVPETVLSSSDPMLESLAYSCLPQTATDLSFSGKVSLTAEANTREGYGSAPKWKATGRVDELSVSWLDDGTSMSAANLRTPFGASGIGSHADIHPLFIRADSVTAGAFSLTNAFASIRATETALLATEAGCDVCGGKARVYSTFLRPDRLDAGTTLFLDNIDAHEAVKYLAFFDGDAAGRLFGKLPLRIKGGKEIVLGEGFLYSAPGRKGRLSIRDSSYLTAGMAAGGVPADVRSAAERALMDLEYSALAFELTKEGEESYALRFTVEGTSEESGKTVPVSIETTLHGELNQLINFGIRAANRKETAK